MRLLVAFLLLFAPGLAVAQQALDATPNALPDRNFGFIRDTRWMPTINIASLASAGSQRIAAMMAGELVEGWLSLDTSQTVGATGDFRVNVSISPRGGATIFPAGQFNINLNTARNGDPVNLIFPPGAIFNEGDAIIIGIPTITGAVASVVRINLRVRDR